jgi:hypothetical protein
MAKWEAIDPSELSVCKEPAAAPPRYVCPDGCCNGTNTTSTCYDGTDLMVVRVNDDSRVKDYTFYGRLLAWHSSYFAAATDPAGGFETSGKKVLELSGSHQVFDAFHCWVWTGRLKDPPASDAPIEDRYLPRQVLYDLWFFADLRGIPSLGNSAVDMIHERATSAWLSPRDIQYVYNNTMAESKLRALIVDWYSMTERSPETLKNHTTMDPTVDFLHAVYPRLAQRGHMRVSRAEMVKVDRCRWHDHSGPGGKLRLESRKKRKRTE